LSSGYLARASVAAVSRSVKRGDAYKILDNANGRAPSGGEALALAQQGDLASARLWLNWEREEITRFRAPILSPGNHF
jgi:hypothetical protein